MSIYRRGREWYADFYVDGKRVRRSLNTIHKAKALDRYKAAKDEYNISASGKGPTFAAVKKQYLEWAWSAHPASAAQEEMRLKRIESMLTQIGVTSLGDITSWHVEQLRATLKADEHIHSPATVNRYLQLLRGMFYRAADWGAWSGPNPVRRVKFARESPERRLLSEAEVGRIVAAAEAIAAKSRHPLPRAFPDLVRFAYNTGLRKSELLDLRWSAIGLDEMTVRGKGEKRRTVPLNAEALAVLARQPRRYPTVWSIPGHRGSMFRRVTERVRKITSIPFHFHLLRHAFASRLLAAGVDIVTISDLLGHSKIMTSLLYSHTDAARKRRAVDTLTDSRQVDVKRVKARKLQKKRVPLA